MSKLPVRNPSPGYIKPEGGIGYVIASESGEKRTIITAHGIHLVPSDFSDLFLPALIFVDMLGNQHEVSVNERKELLIDGSVVFDTSMFCTKQEAQSLRHLTSADGQKWLPTITNDGIVTYKKID